MLGCSAHARDLHKRNSCSDFGEFYILGSGGQQIVDEHCRDNDIEVNVCRAKKMTNIRAASADKTVVLRPPREMTLEMALEFIEDDELVEVTPDAIRLRKRLLTESDRKRAARGSR